MNAIETLKSLNGQLNYTNDVIENKDLDSVELKEYKSLKAGYENEISELKNHINNNFDVFGVAV